MHEVSLEQTMNMSVAKHLFAHDFCKQLSMNEIMIEMQSVWNKHLNTNVWIYIIF